MNKMAKTIQFRIHPGHGGSIDKLCILRHSHLDLPVLALGQNASQETEKKDICVGASIA